MPSFKQLFSIIVAAILLLRPTNFMGDPGLGWHLRSGEWIWNAGIPHLDPFLFGQAAPWVHNQWLSDALAWMVWRVGGWPLLEVSMIVLLLALLSRVLSPLIAHHVKSDGVQALTFFCVILFISIQWFLRPVVLSVVLFAIVLSVLNSARAQAGSVLTPRQSFLLVCLFALWSNLHPGFPLGFALLGLSFLFDSRTARERIRFVLLGLACLGATLLNPYTFRLHQQILALMGDSYFMNLNMEWLSPDFGDLYFAPILAVLVLLIFLAPFIRTANWTRFEWASLLLFLVASLSTRRYLPFFGVVLAVPLAKLFYVALNAMPAKFRLLRRLLLTERKDAPYLLGAVSALLVLLAFFRILPHGKAEEDLLAKNYPLKFAQRIEELNLPIGAGIFNSPNHGGLVIWTLWPKVWPVVDDRNEINGQARYERFFAVLRGDTQSLQDAVNNFSAVVLPPTPALVSAARKLNEIEIVNEEPDFIVIRKSRQHSH